MLSLTRKENEVIHIGDDIFITVTQINRFSVRLAIKAPKHIPVHRSEVYLKIQQNKKASQPENPKIEYKKPKRFTIGG